MAKKKDFSNIVEESFNDGYVSEPEVEVTAKAPEKVEETPAPAEAPVAEVTEETQEQPTEEVIEEAPTDEAPVEETPAEEITEDIVEEPEEELTESEILLKRLTDGDEELLNDLWYKQERATYYLTGIQRACIDIMAREEVMSKNAVVNAAYEKFFSDAIKEAAKEEVVRKTIKTLKRQVEEEKKNK